MTSPEALQGGFETETDKEATQRLLGNLGLYTCELDAYENPNHPADNIWLSNN